MICFLLFQRFCPLPGASKGELGNTSSLRGTVRFSVIVDFYCALANINNNTIISEFVPKLYLFLEF